MGKFLAWAKDTLSIRGRSHGRLKFAALFRIFQKILKLNNQILELMADMGDKLGGDYVFDQQYIRSSCRRMADLIHKLIYNLNALAPKKYRELENIFMSINDDIEEELAGRLVIPRTDHIMFYDIITRDFADVVGGKNANIAEVRNRLDLPAPEGFAITTRAFKSFFDHNQLQDKIQKALSAWEQGRLSREAASREIRSLITSGVMPGDLARAIEKALRHLQHITGQRDLFLAIRSSAMGEDSEHTFAGQFLTLLNQPRQDLVKCYKDVLASSYSPSAMEYRRQKGFAEHEVAMAVACQCMVDAAVSGVLYTMDPLTPASETMVLTANWGLGAPVVAGKVKADQFRISREAPHEVRGLDIVRKTKSLEPVASGGCRFRSVRKERQTIMCLTEAQIRRIAETGLMIERYFKKPQDIEWVIDPDDVLYILQTRPLNIRARIADVINDVSSVKEKYPVIFSGRGSIAQNGIAAGKVFPVRSDEDLDHFPDGAILVAGQTSPRFAKVVRKAGGIITDVGSPTGHMATISREFRVPTIVNTGIATQVLKPGQVITMDAEENVVYEGRIRDLCYYGFLEDSFEETYEFRLLRRILKKITPLHLIDPHDRNFVPSACRTFHDITRFVHEKAVEELIDLNYHHHHDVHATGKKLKSEIPLDLIIIDIGGGLTETENRSTVTPEQILSVPMAAFLKGLGTPGAWSRDPMSVDFGSFMSSLTRTFSSGLANPRYVGQNLAVISGEYTNINLRLGYHFNMIDAYISGKTNDNYAYFRFFGGVTDPARRSRRAKFIAEALEKNDFSVDLRGDLVVGRIKKLGVESMRWKMHLLGQLVAFTRQLDVQMNSDQKIGKFVGEFERLVKSGEGMNRGGRDAQ